MKQIDRFVLFLGKEASVQDTRLRGKSGKAKLWKDGFVQGLLHAGRTATALKLKEAKPTQ